MTDINLKIIGSKTSLLEKNFTVGSSLKDCESKMIISQDDDKLSTASFSVGKRKVDNEEATKDSSTSKTKDINILEEILKTIASNIKNENNEEELSEVAFEDRSYLPQDVNACIRSLVNNLKRTGAPQELIDKIIGSFDLDVLSTIPGVGNAHEMLKNFEPEEIIKEHALFLLKGAHVHFKSILDKSTVKQLESVIDKYDPMMTFSQENEKATKENEETYIDKPFLPKDVNDCIRALIQNLDELQAPPFAKKGVRKKFEYENLSINRFKEEEEEDDDDDNNNPSSNNKKSSQEDIACVIKHNVIGELTAALKVMDPILSEQVKEKLRETIDKYKCVLYFPLFDRELTQKELDDFIFEDKSYLPKDVNECIRSILKDFNQKINLPPHIKKDMRDVFDYDTLSGPPGNSEDDDSFDDAGVSDYDRAINIKNRIISIFKQTYNFPFISKETKKQIKSVIKKYKDDYYFSGDDEE